MKKSIYIPNRIYLSGQISGLEPKQYEHNFKIAKWMLEVKHGNDKITVINPVEIKPLFGIKSYWFYMIADIWHLIQCDTIYMLSNYHLSRGANIEKYIAELLKIKVMYQ